MRKLRIESRTLAAAILAVGLGACTTVSQVTTLEDPACAQVVARAIGDVLHAQGESDRVEELADSTTDMLRFSGLGPRTFLVAAPSGTDYSFFVQRKDDTCLLRLYAREKGFTSYVNNLTYIETQPLPGCGCAE